VKEGNRAEHAIALWTSPQRDVILKPGIVGPATILLAALAVWLAPMHRATGDETAAHAALNLALYATPSTSYVSGHESLDAINNGYEPRDIADHSHGAYGNWPRTGRQWVEYEWPTPVSTNKVGVYWWEDHQGVYLPVASRLLYWNGTDYVPVPGAHGVGVEGGRYNTISFPEITTARLRLEFDSDGEHSTGIIQWKVYDSGKSPAFRLRVLAGVDRTTVLPGKTYLHGKVLGFESDELLRDRTLMPPVAWSQESGPGQVTFADATSSITTAGFSAPGDYVLKMTAGTGDSSGSNTLRVSVQQALTLPRLEPIYTRSYSINNPLWNARLKPLIVTWIPHCIDEISDPQLKEGGLENFVQAGNKLAGRPYVGHVGYPFSNAWVLNTVESMCVALMFDAQGDPQILAAQARMRTTLDQWIPIILAAQEPDGYLQTRFTLGTPREIATGRPHPRWTLRGEHEGYVAGYFLEASIADYLRTDGHDLRMYNAAKRLADCWVNNIGPSPKRTWFDGHEEMEQALVRFGRFVNDVEGDGHGDAYVALAKFLLDSRRGNDPYDQTQAPVVEQYEAVGHAVRAAYLFSGMADIAAQTHDVDYESAVRSLWDNLVNKKWYVTGGIGSGESPEGFGKDYSLPNNAYCESCSNCGALFFQWKMNLAYHDSRYSSLYEETLYNAILGDYDLAGANFTYTNALSTDESRYPWHVCPCCVGNFPRTLLMLPTWMYSTGDDDLYVNLFVGSTVTLPKVGGTRVQIIQQTDYPWNGKVSILLNPAEPTTFTLHIRVPDRAVSTLYSDAPSVDGIGAITLNGAAVQPQIENGYAVISRKWSAGDKVEFDLPMQPYRVKAIDKVKADRGRVALKFGPLVYNIESADQNIDKVLADDSPLTAEWKPDFLGGVMVLKGKFTDGSEMTAIPNFARENRGGRSIVWIRDR
jgi:DUF1680 family protein